MSGEHSQILEEGTNDKKNEREARKVRKYLDQGERVLVVARQSRWKSGGSTVYPGTVFATTRRLIIRDPSTLGLRANISIIPYSKITSVRVKHGLLSNTLEFTAPGMEGAKGTTVTWGQAGVGEIRAIEGKKADMIAELVSRYVGEAPSQDTISVADELAKLDALLKQGVLTQEEFQKLKSRLIQTQ